MGLGEVLYVIHITVKICILYNSTLLIYSIKIDVNSFKEY